MSSTQIKTRDAYGVTYADPADPDFTVRFKTTTSNKVLNGNSVPNYVTEVIANDAVNVALGTQTLIDNVSVRVRVSGSKLSDARKKAVLKSVATQLASWADEAVFSGFEPVTVPLNPAL